MARETVVYWQDGPTHGIAVLTSSLAVWGSGIYLGGAGLVVTNDGVAWAAERTGFVLGVLARIGVVDRDTQQLKKGLSLRQLPHGTTLLPEYRLPLAWARKTAKVLGEIYTTPALDVASTVRLARAHGPGEIAYTGFGTVAKKSHLSLAALHALIDQAVADCAGVWGWEASGLEVKFHSTSKSFGLAYSPGTGKVEGVRRISLHQELLALFDDASCSRVVWHELCHHYRDERFALNRFDAHDAIFCRELGRIDSLVLEDPKRCAQFHDDRDTSLVAEAEAKKTQPLWEPEAGVLELRRLKDGTWKMEWRSTGSRKWPRWVRSISDKDLLDLTGRFPVGRWTDVRVEADDWPTSLRRGVAPENLATMVRFFADGYPQQLPKTRALLSRLEAEADARRGAKAVQ